ncbi:MAG: zinc-finger domain-containing protein [Rhodobacteraceae bacterium]|nr:zinc-finger domain-containing protein [Paracoccaceae bacterium]
MSHASPEPTIVTSTRIACDGGEGALGHPRVWLTLPATTGTVTCPYCDAHFRLAEGVSAH